MKNKNYKHPMINRAIKLYRYAESIDIEELEQAIQRRYNFSFKNYKKNKYDFSTFIGKLSSIGEGKYTHILAKNLLYQGNPECWAYFERTAVFWTHGHLQDPFIDHIKGAFEYALLMERTDLIKILFSKSLKYLAEDDYRYNKEYYLQKIYPSTLLVHFLIEKWLGENPVLPIIMKYRSDYGIYQQVIDHWDDLRELPEAYWKDLCEYHLKRIGLSKAEKREYEEFLDVGLMPMELLNLIKVRRKLGLDIPKITHELMETSMVKQPMIPTGYNEEKDVIYRLISETARTEKLWTLEEIIALIKEESIEKRRE